MFYVKINKEKCKFCGMCMEVCPESVFCPSDSFNKMGCHYVCVDSKKNCSGCKRCVLICPDRAIEIYKEDKSKT